MSTFSAEREELASVCSFLVERLAAREASETVREELRSETVLCREVSWEERLATLVLWSEREDLEVERRATWWESSL